MASPIEDYAIIGDCETAGLVSKNGSLDWLCLPRFDSPACFAALLGTPEHGRWLIEPRSEVRAVRRRYRPDTLILETEIETDEGVVLLTDCMPLRNRASDVVRLIEGKKGSVPMRMDLTVRFDYGSIVPWVRHGSGGIDAIAGPDAVRLQTPIEMHGADYHSIGEFTVHAGDRIPSTITWFPSHMPEPAALEPFQSIADTEQWWKEWSAQCTYRGPYQEQVLRSLITLKSLTYAPTGGVIAALTTSLPEQIGGPRNWDYRYCWLRDATFTLFALLKSGYMKEARDWREWLIRAVAGKPSEIQIMYGISGERRLHEFELDWLPGYENSAPVRIGNAAAKQHQLDVYGEVMAALHVARVRGLEPSENAWRVQTALMDFLESDWHKPDEGIWEVRGPQRHFTHSKVMAWVAADRAVKAVERFGMDGPIQRWQALRATIHEEVCRKGFDADLNSFVQFYGSDEVDASLLMLPLVGFLPGDDPRVLGTVRAVEDTLLHEGLVYRYISHSHIDGLPAGEGTFLVCSFWLVDNYVLQGRLQEARHLFEHLLSLCNDVGLLAEEYCVESKRMLGNFPQAFSHLGVINSARNLLREEPMEKPHDDAPPEEGKV